MVCQTSALLRIACALLVFTLSAVVESRASVNKLIAQEPKPQEPKTQEQTGAASAKLVLAFRMEDWQAAHFDDAEKATQHAKILNQLGCEVKTVQHNGHTDIQCKTTFWKSLALDDREQVNQWKAWFEAFGFDTIHGAPARTETSKAAPGEDVKEIVKYRQAAWKTLHAHQPQQVSQLLALYRALGCEIEEVDHGGHTDLKVRCPAWREMELPSHEAAHKWQEFLKNASFETQHEH